MKKFLLFSIAVLTLASCKSPEQKIVEDFILPRVKCPATFKVVEFTARQEPEDLKYDTLYRIAKINGKKTWDGTYPSRDTRSIEIDSVCGLVITYPKHTLCVISFDAQNLMGATVRNSETVVLDEQLKPYSFANWFTMCENNAVEQEAVAQRVIVSEFGMFAPLYFEVGDWVEKSKLCK